MAEHGIARDRPAGGQPLSVRAASSAKPGCTLDEMRSRTSTSAARRCCARRRRTSRASAVATDPAQYAGCWTNWTPTTARCRRRRASRCRSPRSTASRSTTRHQRLPLRRIGDDGTRSAVPGAAQQQLRQGAGPALRREPAPARPRSTATCSRCRARWRRSRSCRARSCRYNNIADADAAWECVRQFDAPACVIVKHANPCGVADRRGLRRCLRAGLRDRSDLAPSAASSPSTARSTRRPRRRSSTASSSRC